MQYSEKAFAEEDGMYREIKKRLLILKNRQPYQPEIAEYMGEMNRLDWICSCRCLSGEAISRENIKKILDGELVVEVGLQTHQLIFRYAAMMKRVESMLEMDTSLGERELLELYRFLLEPEPQTRPDGSVTYYRRNNPVLAEWKYTPPDFREVGEQMKLLFHWLLCKRDEIDPDMDPILRAAVLHNRLIEIYPFDSDSALMARAAMFYELRAAGFPPVRLDLDEQEYNEAIVLYLKKEDSTPLYNALLNSICNQLGLMMQITAIG